MFFHLLWPAPRLSSLQPTSFLQMLTRGETGAVTCVSQYSYMFQCKRCRQKEWNKKKNVKILDKERSIFCVVRVLVKRIMSAFVVTTGSRITSTNQTWAKKTTPGAETANWTYLHDLMIHMRRGRSIEQTKPKAKKKRDTWSWYGVGNNSNNRTKLETRTPCLMHWQS